MLDIVLHQIVHVEYFYDTLSILQNFQKGLLFKNVIRLHSGFLHSNTILQLRKRTIRRWWLCTRNVILNMGQIFPHMHNYTVTFILEFQQCLCFSAQTMFSMRVRGLERLGEFPQNHHSLVPDYFICRYKFFEKFALCLTIRENIEFW